MHNGKVLPKFAQTTPESNSPESFNDGFDELSILLSCGQESYRGDLQVFLEESSLEENF